MSAAEIYGWWSVWLGVAGVLVVAAAALLITIWVLAHRIGTLAAAALGLVEEIEQQTKPIWQLNTTNRVAGQLLGGAQSIEAHVGTIAASLAAGDEQRAA